ncbi:DoxX family protein [Cumulibacter soli]|uniref:DoxX family protein n=1 Tax=Cumulibacter soli TaxID=2546344 RepID=UPI001067E40E|nr:DoxX family protein [Cumulibacter soli]
MDTALWIIAGILAVAFSIGGIVKLTVPKETFAAKGGAAAKWTEDFSSAGFKRLGVLELLGGLGLVLPAMVGIGPILVPFAALGMTMYMTGAATTRILRHEPVSAIAGDLLFIVLTIFLVWGRFSAVPFEA